MIHFIFVGGKQKYIKFLNFFDCLAGYRRTTGAKSPKDDSRLSRRDVQTCYQGPLSLPFNPLQPVWRHILGMVWSTMLGFYRSQE